MSNKTKEIQSLISDAAIAIDEKKYQEAYATYKRIIALDPENAEVLLKAGSVCLILRKSTEAVKYLKKSLLLNQNLSDSYLKLAQFYFNHGKTEMAINLLLQSQEKIDDDVRIYFRLAQYYFFIGNYKNCNIQYFKALQIAPKNKEVLYNAGITCKLQSRHKPALTFLFKAYDISKEAKTALAIGKIHYSLDQYEDSFRWFEKIEANTPEHIEATYYRLFYKMKICDWSRRDEDEQLLIKTLERHMKSKYYELGIPCLNFNFFEVPMSLHLEMNMFKNEQLKRGLKKLQKHVSFEHSEARNKQLHIGYISPDFNDDHPIGRCLSQLFKHHNRQKVKVFAYSLAPLSKEKPISKSIISGCDVFIDLYPLSTIESASQIYNDQIDVLVDLAGHTSFNRLGILGLQPAPIQSHLMGYPGTTGLDFIHFLFADERLIPRTSMSYYSEKIVYLPSCFIDNRAITDACLNNKKKNDVPDRESLGLPSSAFVFVAFNRPDKIDPQIFSTWMNILQAVDNSVLWLSDFNKNTRQNILNYTREKGVSEKRIIFATRLSYEQYIQSYQNADLFLDTLYYSAGSTAMAALGARVPVLTCMADSNASRMGASIVTAAGLEELVCDNLPEYEQKAISLAKTPSLLNQYKTLLNKPEHQIPLFNNKQFAENLEIAFQSLWEDWANKQDSKDTNFE